MGIVTDGIDLAKNIFAEHGVHPWSKRLMQQPGIGSITASALLARIGSDHDLANGCQVATWIGLMLR